MRKLIAVVVLFSLLLSLVPGAVFAQDGASVGDGAAAEPASTPAETPAGTPADTPTDTPTDTPVATPDATQAGTAGNSAPTGTTTWQVFLPTVAGGANAPATQTNPPGQTGPNPLPPPPDMGFGNQMHGHVTTADRLAAAKRAEALGQKPATAEGIDVAAAAMGSSPHFFGPFANFANSPLPQVVNGNVISGIRKFVDTLPGLGEGHANNLGQYIPLGVADATTYPGADYYEIAVVQYKEQMHSDLPPTTLRGYVQLATSVVPGKQFPLTYPDGSPILLPNGSPALAVDKPHYLGPMIMATKDRPVRILFRNLLPTGLGGDLFLPVDTTVMGSGMGPNMMGMQEMDPRNPMCGMKPKPAGCYAENRATLHLHGGITPWISDGTPHQWITPAGDSTAYPAGVSVQNVPDMPDPGPGAMTFFYTNQQSARLMFYHDHAWGITRLNVYAGEAAGYLITDSTEQALISQGTIPVDQIPLIIQDKTFVPSQQQLATTDPLWDMNKWGKPGDLWLPHVYMPAQNPGDKSGVNRFGRWAYGAWFWPPVTTMTYGPIANPYYNPSCNPDLQWCEPPTIPGVPNVSMGMEAFNDTPLVNGTAYPVLTVDPQSYRFRILDAASDRFFNLSLYKADPADPGQTEVALNPQEVAAAKEDPNVFPTPVTGNEGPDWIQIGTEGGFLPAPAVIPPQPITWATDMTVFNAGNVEKHSLLLGPAERADVIVDFSQYAGQTLILYNDAPAAFPARDPRYDYYTGSADLTDIGGAPTVLPGYGPNTRTVMKIIVKAATPAAPFDLPKLQAAFEHHADNSGVFESSQNPIIVGQASYNSAYGTSFNSNGPLAGLVQIYDTSFTFKTLTGNTLTMPLQPKMIQDEMGEAFDKDYGRMSGSLGVETPNANAANQNMILYPYINPATEILSAINVPFGVQMTPIMTTTDGTQIWKITHNGVDTHPIHFHLTDVQLINRVGWDGIIRQPDPNELGWKDTVRISPLEDTTVAMRPVLPKTPFGVPDSIRPLDPMSPIGSTTGFNSIDTNGNGITPPISNQLVNFGWEYVWHCHILSHEEMDMMRPIILQVFNLLPPKPTQVAGNVQNPTPDTVQVQLTWTDPTPPVPANWGNLANEVGFRVERATGNGPFKVIAQPLANQTSFVDTTVGANSSYRYRVSTYNAAGSGVSDVINVTTGGSAKPSAPTGLAASVQNGNSIRVTWSPTTGATGYIVSRTGGTRPFQPVTLNGNTSVRYNDQNVVVGTSYTYSVVAVNGNVNPPVNSDPSTVSITVPFPEPTNFRVTNRGTTSLSLSWNAVQAGQQVQVRYEIWQSADGTNWSPTTGASALSGTNFTVNGLTTRTTYWFEIRAYTTSTPPLYSVWTNPINATTR